MLNGACEVGLHAYPLVAASFRSLRYVGWRFVPKGAEDAVHKALLRDTVHLYKSCPEYNGIIPYLDTQSGFRYIRSMLGCACCSQKATIRSTSTDDECLQTGG